MSALAMVLAAGMAVGNGSERVSAEVEQRLDLHGEWEGVWYDGESGNCIQLQIARGLMTGQCGDARLVPLAMNRIVDEGNGKLHLSWPKREVVFGIYEQTDDHVTIRCCHPVKGCSHLHLLILHRVKPGK